MKLAVLITTLDEYDQTQKTIASIRETAPKDVPVIVVDDGSQVPLTLLDKSVKLIRNEIRAGVGASRHIAALNTDADYILITDSHVRFEPGWYEKTLEHIKGRNTTLFCGSCVGLSEHQMDMKQAKVSYFGAHMKFYGPDANKPNLTQILECCWEREHEGDDYPLSGVMGAAYLMATDWFHHIGGLRLLRHWAGDEQSLALKTWLAGGEVRMFKGLRIGHMFRDAAHYKSSGWCLLYNKLIIIHTCLPPERAQKLISLFPNTREFSEAKRKIEEDANLILSEAAYNRSIFVRDFDWFLKYFNISFPS